jgi:N-acetylglucosamine kinase-like BadF-type ATPase
MTWRPNTAIAFIGDHEVTVVDVLARELETIAGVDTVVIRTHGVPNDALYAALDGKVPELARVGDAQAVRFVDRAVYDGHIAARAL